MKIKNLFHVILLLPLLANGIYLSDFSRNIYSQFGEDGIIEKIFEIIGIKSKICIECGASNGISSSNTCNLWRNNGWKAILIECNEKLFKELNLNTKNYNTINIEIGVGISPNNSLESLILPYTQSCDLLSIDIDGNDYYLFQSLNNIRPRVIICEFNPTIPPHIDMYGPYSYENKIGCSLKSLVRLAKEKKYKLVALTTANAIFITEEEYFKLFNFEKPDILKHSKLIKYLISDYSGNYIILGEFERMPWGIKSYFKKDNLIINNINLYEHKIL